MSDHIMADAPVLSIGGEKDERSDGVFLLRREPDGEEKTTAEDCGDFWMVRDWELTDIDGIKHWFCGWAYSIDKGVVAVLHEKQERVK